MSASLQRMGGGFACPDLGGFLAWWASGLAAWLPAGLRTAVSTDRDRLLLQPQGDGLQLRRQHGEALADVAHLPLPLAAPAGGDPLAGVLRDGAGSMPRWLLLPASEGLRRTLTVPAAARERLREVLGFEIERQTPFAAGNALYDGRVLQVREDGQLQVELVVLPRRRFDALAVQLGSLAGTLSGLDLADADGRPLGVNLLPRDRVRPQRDAWRWWKLGLGGGGIVLLLLGLARIVDNREAAAEALAAEVSQRSAQARGVSARRQQLVEAVEGTAYLQAKRNGRASAVEVIDALSTRLPDGAYLEKLAIEGEQLTLIGLSNEAAALVGRLEGAAQWEAPALAGALQQDPRTRMDRFTLVAKLRGAAVKEAAGGKR